MVSLALPLLLAVAATVSLATSPVINLSLPEIFADGNTEFHNNLAEVQKMLQSLDLTSIAYQTHVKIGTPVRIKGKGVWNAQVQGDEETLRQRAKIPQMMQDDIAKLQKQNGTKKIMKRDLGDKMVVFLVNDLIEK